MIKQVRVRCSLTPPIFGKPKKAKGRLIDFSAFTEQVRASYSASTVLAYYYTAYPALGTRSYSLQARHNFYVYLERRLGFIVRKKPLKRIVTNMQSATVIEKGNMDVEITIDAVDQRDNFDVAVFCSGDSDFLPLINYLRNNGKKVYVYSSRNSVSSELRTGTDGYTDLLSLNNIWGTALRRR
jgi:uncharacterized LabA/DUF88 family protein